MKTLAVPTQRVLSSFVIATVLVLTGCTADSLTGPDLSPSFDVEVAATTPAPVLFDGGLGDHNNLDGGLGDHNNLDGGLGDHNNLDGGLGDHNNLEGGLGDHNNLTGGLGDHNNLTGGLGDHNN